MNNDSFNKKWDVARCVNVIFHGICYISLQLYFSRLPARTGCGDNNKSATFWASTALRSDCHLLYSFRVFRIPSKHRTSAYRKMPCIQFVFSEYHQNAALPPIETCRVSNSCFLNTIETPHFRL